MVFDWNASKYAAISGLQTEVGQILIDTIQVQPNEKILDIGCGIGNLTVELASRCNKGFVLGIGNFHGLSLPQKIIKICCGFADTKMLL